MIPAGSVPKGRNPDPQGGNGCCPKSSVVIDRVQYEPNYAAKSQNGMEAATMKVGKKVKR